MHPNAVQGSTRHDSSGHDKANTASDAESPVAPAGTLGGHCAREGRGAASCWPALRAADGVQPKRLTLGKQEASQEQQDKEQEGAAGAGNCLVPGKGANGAEHGDAHAVHEGQQQHKGEEPRGLGGTASLQAAALKQVNTG